MSVYPRVLQSVLLPAYDYCRSRRYTERRRGLEQSQWWDRERILDFQWKELQKLLAHAFTSVPYLRQKYRAAGFQPGDVRTWDDFRRLPALTRDEINANPRELCSTAYEGRLLPHATGGSTGTPTRFFRTYESYDWRTAAKDRVYSWSGWRLGERSIYLWGAPVGPVSRPQILKVKAYDRLHRQVIVNTFSQSEELWRRLYVSARKHRPVLAVGYVSSLEQFARFLVDNRWMLPGLKAVIAAAEPLVPDVRQTIERGFGAPVFNTYGSREFMSVAGECEQHDGLHVNAENLVVETAGLGSAEPSEILVTDLHNFGMPFVRYATGDLATISTAACPCGRGLPRLESIEGRALDVLRTVDGRLVPGEFFPHLLKDVPEITNYRVEQAQVDQIVIVGVVSRPLSDRSRRLLDTEIRKVFGPATFWELRAVSEIPPLASGKRRVTVGLAASA
jgi:phenylacetate-CoA ligase